LDLLVLLADYLFLANKICLKESRGRHGRDRMVDVLRKQGHIYVIYRMVGIPSIWIIPPYVCTCQSHDIPRFPSTYVVFCVFNDGGER
jgi:hypothetical protein